MQNVRLYAKGFVVGFLFGTVGVFVLALLSLVHPLFETLAAPLLQPGKSFAGLIAGPSASSGVVLLLYIFTGVFYGCLGIIIQSFIRVVRERMRSPKQ